MKTKEKARELVNIFGSLYARLVVNEIFKAMEKPINFKYEFTKQQKEDWGIHRINLNKYWKDVQKQII